MNKPAQLVGMLITALVVFGTDLDVLIAVPLGVMAGAIVTFALAIDERRQENKKNALELERKRMVEAFVRLERGARE
jgi:hypothetical protein